MLIRKFKENPGLKSNLSERAVVLDPDLIDLTMIPPPMTPDEVHNVKIKIFFQPPSILGRSRPSLPWRCQHSSNPLRRPAVAGG